MGTNGLEVDQVQAESNLGEQAATTEGLQGEADQSGEPTTTEVGLLVDWEVRAKEAEQKVIDLETGRAKDQQDSRSRELSTLSRKAQDREIKTMHRKIDLLFKDSGDPELVAQIQAEQQETETSEEFATRNDVINHEVMELGKELGVDTATDPRFENARNAWAQAQESKDAYYLERAGYEATVAADKIRRETIAEERKGHDQAIKDAEDRGKKRANILDLGSGKESGGGGSRNFKELEAAFSADPSDPKTQAAYYAARRERGI